MRGAIVGFSNQNQCWAAFRRIKAEILHFPVEEKTCLVFILPCTQEMFVQMTESRKNRLLRRLVHQLQKSKIECVYAPELLRNKLAGKFFLPDGRRIFCAVAGHIIERHCKSFSLTPENTSVGIYENPFTTAGLSAAQYMTRYTKQLMLVSSDRAGTEMVLDALFEEYGLAAQLATSEKRLNTANVVLLLSAPPQEVLSSGLILDFTGEYPYRAQRNYYFETAFGYADFFRYFGRADCRAAEFVLCCCDVYAEETSIALGKIGWKMKKA